jgi:hypothetical protein
MNTVERIELMRAINASTPAERRSEIAGIMKGLKNRGCGAELMMVLARR